MSDKPRLTPGSEPHNASETHVPGWNTLPAELRLGILEILARETSGWGACPSVCKEWQAILEKESFRRLKVGVECLDDLEAIVNKPQARLVRHIWLNIELMPYSCGSGSCYHSESDSCSRGNQTVVCDSVVKLCSILSRWPVIEGSGLTLELSMQSPSDKEHSFRNLYFGGEDDYWTFDPHSRHPADSGVCKRTQSAREKRHGWCQGRQTKPPCAGAIARINGGTDWLDRKNYRLPDLLSIYAVTRFLLRRQCRRRFNGHVLEPLLGALPRLQSFVYEPWHTPYGDLQAKDDGNTRYSTMPHLHLLTAQLLDRI